MPVNVKDRVTVTSDALFIGNRPLPPLPHAMVWCSGRSRDPGLEWLRDRLRPIAKQNFAR